MSTGTSPTFGNPISVESGSNVNPYSLAVGQLNGDNNSDLVVANGYLSTVTVLSGNGNNPFSTTTYTVGTSPIIATAIGDFNGDGKPDIAVLNASTSSNNVSILLNNGSGFTTASSFSLGTSPDAIATANFNGAVGLVVANENLGSTGTISVALGNGNGTFSSANSYTVGTTPYAVATGDFNGDGKPDIVVANRDSNTVSILLNNGNGTFSSATNVTVGNNPVAVAVGDFSNDGKPDIVVADSAISGGTPSISLLLNNGSGGFNSSSVTNFTVSCHPYAVAVGDFNGDGKLDFASANADGTVDIFTNNGSGGFTSTSYTVGTAPLTSLVAGDANNDGKTDLAAASLSNSNVSIILNTTQVPPLLKVPSSQTANQNVSLALTGISITDLNSNINSNSSPLTLSLSDSNGTLTFGSAAFATLTSVNGSNGSSNFTVSGTLTNLNNALSTLSYENTGIYIQDSISLTVTDSSAGTSSSVSDTETIPVTINPSTSVSLPTFNSPVTVTTYNDNNPYSLATGQLNGDNSSDLVVTNGYKDNVSVLLSNNSTFATATDYTIGGPPTAAAIGDFNGDGKPDIAVLNSSASSNNDVSILVNNGNGTFTTANSFNLGTSPDAIATADFNGDGQADLVVANENLGSAGTISVTLGNGNGTFSAATSYTVGTTPYAVATGDFNGDSKPDIVVANRDSNTVSILLNNGNGTFGSATNVTVGNNPVAVAVGDFNGDGKPDIVVADSATSGGTPSISLLLNNGSGGFSTVTNFTVSCHPYAVAVGDFNGDGRLDFASANADGTVDIFANNGSGGFAATSYTIGTSPLSSLVAGDFNGDGKTDLAVASSTTGNISVLYNTSTSESLSVGTNNTIDNGNNFGSLLFNLQSDSSNAVSQIGVFAVNGDNGAVTYDGTTYTPGEAGYTEAALSESNILYSLNPLSPTFAIPNVNGTNDPTVYQAGQLLTPGSNLGFFVVTNGTVNQELADLASGQTANQPNVFFNFSAANSDKLSHLQITPSQTNNQFLLQWNTTLGSSSPFTGSLSISTSNGTIPQQATIQPIIDTTNGANLQVQFKVTSNALFSDFVGFYPIENAQGTIDVNGKTLNPGDPGYAAAAISEIVSSSSPEFDQQLGTVTHNNTHVYNPADLPWQSTLTASFAKGSLYAPVLISNGTPQSFESENPNNTAPSNLSTSTVGALPIAYFAFVNANSDGIDHVISLPGNTLGFKDYYGGGDFDYNDVVLHLTPTNTNQVITSQAPTY